LSRELSPALCPRTRVWTPSPVQVSVSPLCQPELTVATASRTRPFYFGDTWLRFIPTQPAPVVVSLQVTSVLGCRRVRTA
jgi:hypothetical protein